MIVIDTSVLIDYFRSKDAGLWQLIESHGGAICGLVRAEILVGARNAADRIRLLVSLNSLLQITTPEHVWDVVGDQAELLRSSGINVPLTDVLLATVAIANNLELWTRDQHFVLIQRALPTLRLFQELP